MDNKMSDDELYAYYEKYKNYQAGIINLSLNLSDLIRLVHLIGDEDGYNNGCDATDIDIDMYD